MRFNCVPTKFICWCPNPQSVTGFCDGVFHVLIKIKWGHWGEPKSNKIGTLWRRGYDTDTHRGKSTWWQREKMAVHKSRREASGAISCRHLHLGLLASRTLRKQISAVHTTQFTVLGYDSHRKLIHQVSWIGFWN